MYQKPGFLNGTLCFIKNKESHLGEKKKFLDSLGGPVGCVDTAKAAPHPHA